MLYLFATHAAWGISVPWPGIEPMPPAVEVESSLNHWTTNIPHEYRHKDCSLLVYTQTIDFCRANPVPLLKSLITSKSFLVNSLVFSTHTFKKSAHRQFYFFSSDLHDIYFLVLLYCAG